MTDYRYRAIQFLNRCYGRPDVLSDAQVAAVQNTLASVIFSTDEEFKRFLTDTDLDRRMEDGKLIMERFHLAYEEEGVRLEIERMERGDFGLDK